MSKAWQRIHVRLILFECLLLIHFRTANGSASFGAFLFLYFFYFMTNFGSCNISSWFCWGNTHFCESCHTKQVRPKAKCKHNIPLILFLFQVAGDYMTKKKPADLPKCPGSKECPLKGNHPPPGSEVCIGCAMCRYVGNF